jgi:hypothetical protein
MARSLSMMVVRTIGSLSCADVGYKQWLAYSGWCRSVALARFLKVVIVLLSGSLASPDASIAQWLARIQ